jgi:predicted nucleotide-binding protein
LEVLQTFTFSRGWAKIAIIEKIEAYSGVGFGVVIYTPCDVGAKCSESSSLKARARQNVVFEHGFLIGKLGRSNVCTLVKGEVETPNDLSGIVYTSMDTANWQLEFAKELKAAGYSVDMNKVI